MGSDCDKFCIDSVLSITSLVSSEATSVPQYRYVKFSRGSGSYSAKILNALNTWLRDTSKRRVLILHIQSIASWSYKILVNSMKDGAKYNEHQKLASDSNVDKIYRYLRAMKRFPSQLNSSLKTFLVTC